MLAPLAGVIHYRQGADGQQHKCGKDNYNKGLCIATPTTRNSEATSDQIIAVQMNPR